MGVYNVTLDCSAADSGNDACWPTAVNVAVPILSAGVFVALLVIVFWFKSKPPEVTDIEMVTEAKPTTGGGTGISDGSL
ncbi:hypothetical protein LSAT2_003069 [Lamellibrachia satsuma]|nr:hypothetical protein LSAT2_003069 [Lamellibrachia satsuma]